MTEFDPSVHCLAANEDDQPVGLIIKKPAESEHVFKVPTARVSLFGLDKLAAEKRKRQQNEIKTTNTDKKPRSEEYDDTTRISFGRSGRKERNYRTTASETPSHPGGVSSEALKRIHERQEHSKSKGVIASSSSQQKKGSRSDRGDVSDYKSDRRDYHRTSSSHRKDDRSSSRDEWEETPSLSRGITTHLHCSVYLCSYFEMSLPCKVKKLFLVQIFKTSNSARLLDFLKILHVQTYTQIYHIYLSTLYAGNCISCCVQYIHV